MKDTVRIFFEASSVLDKKKTGIGYFSYHLVNALSRGSFKIVAFAFNFLGRNSYSIASHIELHYIKFLPAKILSFITRQTGWQLPIEALIPDVKKNDWIFYPNYISYPTIRGVKSIVTIHDLAFLDLPDTLDEKNLKLLKKIMPKSIKRASIILCISEFTKERLLYHFPNINNKDIVVQGIPPILKTKKIDPKRALEKFSLEYKKYILIVGTIEPRKNIKQAVDAFLSLPIDIRNEFKLVILGKVGWKSSVLLEDISLYNKHSPDKQIVITGYVSDSDKKGLYYGARFFVSTSLYEGFGMPLLEAMTYKLPCIVSDIPTFQEVAGDSVTYYSDTSDLSSKMFDLIKNSQRSVSYGDILDAYSWNKFAEKIYESIDQNRHSD